MPVSRCKHAAALHWLAECFSVEDGGQRVPVSRCKHAAALHGQLMNCMFQRGGQRAAGAGVAVQVRCSTALVS